MKFVEAFRAGELFRGFGVRLLVIQPADGAAMAAESAFAQTSIKPQIWASRYCETESRRDRGLTHRSYAFNIASRTGQRPSRRAYYTGFVRPIRNHQAGALRLSITAEHIESPASAAANASAPKPPAGSAFPWIYSKWLDWLVGCGGWSAPLLAATFLFAPGNSKGWAVAFYVMAVIFNYPHFMATIYRAYHSRAQFEKYKIVTLHVTLLVVLTGVVMHASPRFFPWIFTLYIFWSPWHYTGQNFGLLMMFVRRSGAEIQPSERRWLRAAFVASYLMLLASFNTGASNDPLILSLSLPSKFTWPARAVLGAAFVLFTFLGLKRLVRAKGGKALAAPITLAATQFLWFVLPTLLEMRSGVDIPQTRYSSGILAVLHSTQYLWITSYYQRREAGAEGITNWKMGAYFVTLIAGGIALFIPGPWLVSVLFHYDFSTSFLIFLSLVNIHHFILDGQLWKLRDAKVSSMLVDRGAQAGGAAPMPPTRNRSTRRLIARVAIVGLLFLWGGFEEIHFAMRNSEGNLGSLERAAQINPYDSGTQQRIGRTEAKDGHSAEAVAAFEKAVAINPTNIALQESYARALINDGRYDEAYTNYQKFLDRFPKDADALVNYGLLAARFQHPEAAIDAWNKALEIDANQTNAHLYLAQAYDASEAYASAERHWKAYLDAVPAQSSDPVATIAQTIAATVQLGDDEARLNQPSAAAKSYANALEMGQQAKQPKLESLALVHLADVQEKAGDMAGALQSYQRALSIDATAGDSYAEGLDWFNYGQFLRRRGVEDDLVYACFARADTLMTPKAGPELDTVRAIRRQIEAKLGKQAATAEHNVDALLPRALSLTSAAL
jgi:tetratricopeptide (TPR) repeat protein